MIDEPPALRGSGRTSGRGSLAERDLLRALMLRRDQLDAVAERIGPDAFHVAAYRRIFAALVRGGEAMTVEALAQALDEDTVPVLQNQLLVDPAAVGDPVETIASALARLRVRAIDESLRELERALALADSAEKDQLVQRMEKLAQEKRALGGRTHRSFR